MTRDAYREGWRRGEIDLALTEAGVTIYSPTDRALADLAGEAERQGDYEFAERLAGAMAVNPQGLSTADAGDWWLGYYHARSAAHELAMGPVWRWADVERWLAKPRPAGRPRTT